MKELNKEQLSKVAGGEGENGKWYFRYYHIATETSVGEWTGPYDSENDYIVFASDHPINNPGEYRIDSLFVPFSGRTIPTYL